MIIHTLSITQYLVHLNRHTLSFILIHLIILMLLNLSLPPYHTYINTHSHMHIIIQKVSYTHFCHSQTPLHQKLIHTLSYTHTSNYANSFLNPTFFADYHTFIFIQFTHTHTALYKLLYLYDHIIHIIWLY